MTNRQKARIALAKGGSIKGISERYKISVNTLKSWRKGKALKEEVVPQVVPKTAVKLHVWMRSLHHESAHLVDKDGATKCGAKVPYGMRWFPGEDTRKCSRCMGHANE